MRALDTAWVTWAERTLLEVPEDGAYAAALMEVNPLVKGCLTLLLSGCGTPCNCPVACAHASEVE